MSPRRRSLVRSLAFSIAAWVSFASVQALPPRLEALLEGARSLEIDYDEGKGVFRGKLSAKAPAREQAQVQTLAVSRLAAPKLSIEGGQGTLAFSPSKDPWFGNPDHANSGELELLLEPGPQAHWSVDFWLPAPVVPGGRAFSLNLGSHRPLRVRLGPNLRAQGLSPSWTQPDQVEGLLSEEGSLTLLHAHSPEEFEKAEAYLRASQKPPQGLLAHGLFRVREDSFFARILIEEETAREPKLELEIPAEFQVLSVRELPTGRTIPFERSGDRLDLVPGPPSGQRRLWIELAGAGPDSEEGRVPSLSLPFPKGRGGRAIELGWIALDPFYPGEYGSLMEALPLESNLGNDPMDRPAPWILEALGESSHYFQAQSNEEILSLSHRRRDLVEETLELEAESSLDDQGIEFTRVDLTLPPKAPWVRCEVAFPEGSYSIRLFVEGEEQALVPSTAGELRYRIQVPSEVGGTYLSYLRDHRGEPPTEDGLPVSFAQGRSQVELQLPDFRTRIGKSNWTIRAPLGMRIGAAELDEEEEAPKPTEAATAPPSEPGEGGLLGSQGQTLAAFESSFDLGLEPQGESLVLTPQELLIRRNQVDPREPLTVRFAVIPSGSIVLGQLCLFFGFCLFSLWAFLPDPTKSGRELSLLAVALFFGLGGIFTGELAALPDTPWARIFLSGILAAVVFRWVAWGLEPPPHVLRARKRRSGGPDKDPDKESSVGSEKAPEGASAAPEATVEPSGGTSEGDSKEPEAKKQAEAAVFTISDDD